MSDAANWLGLGPKEPASLPAGVIQSVGKPAAPSAPAARPIPGKPMAPPETSGPIDYGKVAAGAFKSSVKDSLRLVANATGLLQAGAAKLSQITGTPVGDELGRMREYVDGLANSIQLDEQELVNPSSLADKIKVELTRALASAPTELAKYGAATVATRSPARGMALIEALREMDEPTWEAASRAAIAGVRGGTTGKLLDLTSSLPKMSSRMLAGGAITGVQAAVAGRNPHEIIASVIAGGAFDAALGMRSSAHVPDQTQPPIDVRIAKSKPTPGVPLKNVETLVDGVNVTTPPPGIAPLTGALRSPSQMFDKFPMASKAVRDAIDADITIHSETVKSLNQARSAFRLVSKPGRKVLIEALDDPNITIFNMPSHWTPAMRDAFGSLRTLLEQKRQLIIETKRRAGETVTDDYGIPEGFFPHEFEGRWAVLRSTGKDSLGRDIWGAIDAPNIGWLQLNKKAAVESAKKYTALNPGSTVRVEFVQNLSQNTKNPLRERFFGHAQERAKKPLPGYAKDEEALFHYLRGVERYARISEVRPGLAAAREELAQVYGETSREVKLWDAYADRFEGRPQVWVDALNRWWLQKGGDPDLAQRGLGFIQASQALLKLGFSPVTAMANLTQIVTNTLPVLGPKYTEKGVRGLMSGKYNWLLERLRVADEETLSEASTIRYYQNLRNWPESVKEVPGFVAGGTTAAGMAMFRKAEFANRAVAVIGAYLRAIDTGAGYEKAIRKARDVEVRTQFHYGASDAPIIFANPFVKTVMQFKSYMLKQIEFMAGMRRDSTIGRFDTKGKELRRFVGATMATMGTLGFVPGIEILDYLFQHTIGDGVSLTDEMRRISYEMEQDGTIKPTPFTIPVRGIPGAQYGIETKQIGYGDWPFDPSFTSIEKFVGGPVVSDFANFAKVLAAAPGADRQEAFARAVQGLSPAARRIYNAFLSNAAKQNELRDYKGRLISDGFTLSKKLMSTMGFRPIEESVERERVGRAAEKMKAVESMRKYYYNALAAALARDDREAFSELAVEAARQGFGPITWQGVARAVKTHKQKFSERMERQVQRYARSEPEPAPEPVEETPAPVPQTAPPPIDWNR